MATKSSQPNSPTAGPVAQLQNITERILAQELAIRRAKRERRLARLALTLGPICLISLYVTTVITWRKYDMIFIGAPLWPLSLLATAAGVGYYMLAEPSGAPSIARMELDLTLLYEERRLRAADLSLALRYRRGAYKTDINSDLNEFRSNSKYYRRIHNAFQTVVIIGSIGSSALSALSLELPQFRWTTVGVTFLVGISAGFIGYFKFRERSFYLQQTSDSIEHEWNCSELGIGTYAKLSEEEGLRRLVEEVERLKAEQREREQNLDQPHERQERQEL